MDFRRSLAPGASMRSGRGGMAGGASTLASSRGPGAAAASGGAGGGGATTKSSSQTGSSPTTTGTNANNNNNSTNANTSNKPETFHFPMLKSQAILSCMKDVEVPFTEEELARPNATKMQIVYEAMLDIAVGSAREDLFLQDVEAMGLVAYPDIVVDAVRFYVFLDQMTNMMQKVGIPDFSSRDITKPEADRVRRVLSAVINFIKFRVERQSNFFQELVKMDGLIETIADGEREYEDTMAELEHVRQKRKADEPKIEEQKAINHQLAAELEELKRIEVQLSRTKSEVMNERIQLQQRSKSLDEALAMSKAEFNALKAEVVEVPDNLERDLEELPAKIQRAQEQHAQLTKRLAERQRWLGRIDRVPQDLQPITEQCQSTFGFQQEVQESRQRAFQLENDIVDKQMAVTDLKNRIEQLDLLVAKTTENLTKNTNTTKQRVEKLEEETAAQEETYLEAESVLNASRAALEEQMRKYNDLHDREARLTAETRELLEQNRALFEGYCTRLFSAFQ
ncbi:kinetochore-associated Ndc80 complex subunit nuf2 [Actinomortierella ambigua]|uniref:Kinetochore-associated Ndc80 complex subunit nuf2 n=1 Tax=Actinomortierella ambigua TaxID=1343610 RepID=A0A9P6U0R7_9FUNG|nr:kinetochore-associated Ndc80 complex subunit nuf2 [Actinomortierella ambigua]